MSTSHTHRQSAPFGIKILCFLAVISGAWGIISVLGAMASSPLGIVFGLFSVLLGIAQIVVAGGLWTLQSWA